MSRQTKRRATLPHPPRPGSLQLVNTASTRGWPARPRLDVMPPDEARAWLDSLRERLQQKMARERAYLDRRAGRGTHTPTDDAYEDDQQVEAELLDLLEQCAQSL